MRDGHANKGNRTAKSRSQASKDACNDHHESTCLRDINTHCAGVLIA
jgi:hypothetical protein